MTQLTGPKPVTNSRSLKSYGGVEHSSSDHGHPKRGLDRTMLPNGRAVLGGFLIAASGVGTARSSVSLIAASGVGLFAAYQQAHAAPVNKFVVATHPLAPGDVIERADLGLAPAELPPEMTGQLTDDWRSLVGKETTAAVGKNQLLSPASVVEPGNIDGPARRVSLELSRASALDGDLESGAVVDVLSSTEGDSEATVVAERSRVLAVNADSTGDLGQLGSLVVTIEVADERALAAIVGASASGKMTLAAPTPGPATSTNSGSGHG